MSDPIVRVDDAHLVPDGGPGWFVVSGLSDPESVSSRVASAGGSVTIDGAGRLRALVTPQQLVNAVGRVDPVIGSRLGELVPEALDAWLAPGPDLALPDGQILRSGERTQVMGILNVTPDSFSDGGVAYSPATHPQAAIEHGRALVAAGADLVDVGGESSRPGAQSVPAEEELERVVPVVAALASEGVIVSVDTTKAAVARAAVEAGALIVNDVSAGARDPDLLATVAEQGSAYVLMHALGTPATMQDDPRYGDVVADVYEWLAAGLDRCVAAGIARDRIVVDPGIGFGKTVEHNVELLAALRQLSGLGRPVLVGASRKSFIGALADETDPARREPGSLAVAALAVRDHAGFLRVHDVAGTRQAVAVVTGLARR